MSNSRRVDAAVGCLLGGAIGDALGLPYEGLAPLRAQRLLGAPTRYRFCFGRGMFSDDTEHACLTAQALIASGKTPDHFRQNLASRLRWWFAGLPAGVGLATARASLKLWLGYSPETSGVWSAGNGATMRAPIIGVVATSPRQMRELVEASSRITHRDPRAIAGAWTIACAANHAATHPRPDAGKFLAELQDLIAPDENPLRDLLDSAAASAARGESTVDFAAGLGLQRGVSGFVLHTTPVAIHAWLRYPDDYRLAVQQAILCGGDADTVAFLVGSLVGAQVGKPGLPVEWLTGLCDWPRTVGWIERLAKQATADHSGKPERPLRLPYTLSILRNLFFLSIVLVHGLRRLAPPY